MKGNKYFQPEATLRRMNNKRLKIKDGQVFGILNTQIAKKIVKESQ